MDSFYTHNDWVTHVNWYLVVPFAIFILIPLLLRWGRKFDALWDEASDEAHLAAALQSALARITGGKSPSAVEARMLEELRLLPQCEASLRTARNGRVDELFGQRVEKAVYMGNINAAEAALREWQWYRRDDPAKVEEIGLRALRLRESAYGPRIEGIDKIFDG